MIDDATFSGVGNQIRIDTYGHVFDNFPKILNWSLEEQNYHLNYVGNLNQDVQNHWIKYFTNKKKCLLVDSKQQVSNQRRNWERSMIGSSSISSSTAHTKS